MKVMLATLCLNEMEWLPRLWEQHKDWPGLVGWAFIEAADKVYAQSNPDMVTADGKSIDGTSEWLDGLKDPRVKVHNFGFTDAADPAQGKCKARSKYLEFADELKPDYVMVVDADEFYTRRDQDRIDQIVGAGGAHWWMFKQRHIWRPPSIATRPIMTHEVVNGYWSVPHCRCWKWEVGMRYTDNHNTPTTRLGASFKSGSRHSTMMTYGPQCIHFGFASSLKCRQAKHAYYRARGEGTRDRRQWYVNCRAAFETWKPGAVLPNHAIVIPYTGPVPEVFQCSQS